MQADQLILIIVFFLALVAMFVELLVPGMIMGTIGFLAVVGCVLYAIMKGRYGTTAVLIVCTLALVPAFFLLWKKVASRFLSSAAQEKDFRPSQAIDQTLVGEEGIAMTPLRPSGIARLRGKRYDVITRGEMLEKGARIKVVEVSGNRIVVKRV